jgi:hypothetical protein
MSLVFVAGMLRVTMPEIFPASWLTVPGKEIVITWDRAPWAKNRVTRGKTRKTGGNRLVLMTGKM